MTSDKKHTTKHENMRKTNEMRAEVCPFGQLAKNGASSV